MKMDNLRVKNIRTAKMGSNAVLSRWLYRLGEFVCTVVYHLGDNLIWESRLVFTMDSDNGGATDNDEGGRGHH